MPDREFQALSVSFTRSGVNGMCFSRLPVSLWNGIGDRRRRPTDCRSRRARSGGASRSTKRHLHHLRHVGHAQHVVVVEVGLLHLAVLHRDALVQHAREAIEDAALDVGARHRRLHHQAAVDGEPRLVHADLAARPVDARPRRRRRPASPSARSSRRRARGLRAAALSSRDISRDLFEHRARLRRRVHALEPELDRVHALRRPPSGRRTTRWRRR